MECCEDRFGGATLSGTRARWPVALPVWSSMGRHRRAEASQGNTMEQYSTPVALPQRLARSEVSGEVANVASSAGEPSRAELLAAIQGSRVALEGKIETFAVEVNLLRADLRKVSDKLEEVWRWLEMWEKVAPIRKEGFGGAARGASGSGGPDWRSHGSGHLAESCHRVEIQRDATMAVVSANPDECTASEQNLEAGERLRCPDC
ncbi:hypothetical protein NDU88_002478 [Pleurodeles waltl]|uniref:Uncharacterized protein n=1 Tax=Pleurodeles waltl TaxID=8319 RepID=A0AAV7W2Y5_PLEWA|nr:hypothetical protein NDU88_002478 [Pleurodeles waltl]